MRFLWCVLAALVSLRAQDLKTYLELTPDQTLALQASNASYVEWREQQWSAIEANGQKLQEELAKAPLDAGAIGARAVEGVMLEREAAKRQRQQVVANRLLLIDVQRTRLHRLEQAMRMEATGREAMWNLLIEPGNCTSLYIGCEEIRTEKKRTKEDSPKTITDAPWARIREFLSLTDGQFDKVMAAHRSATEWVLARWSRMADVSEELRLEFAKEQLDGNAIGIRYVELEVTRRAIDERAISVGLEVRAFLTDAQRTKLKALDEALKLSPVIGEAISSRFVGNKPCTQGSSPGAGLIHHTYIYWPGFGANGCYY